MNGQGWHRMALAGTLILAGWLPGCTTPCSQPAACVPALSPQEALIVSGKGTQVYHFCDCRYAKDIPDEQLVGYASPAAAEAQGFVACAVCRPREKYEQHVHKKAEPGTSSVEPGAPPAQASPRTGSSP